MILLLPEAVLFCVLDFLDPKDLMNCMLSNKNLYEMCSNNYIWRRHCSDRWKINVGRNRFRFMQNDLCLHDLYPQAWPICTSLQVSTVDEIDDDVFLEDYCITFVGQVGSVTRSVQTATGFPPLIINKYSDADELDDTLACMKKSRSAMEKSVELMFIQFLACCIEDEEVLEAVLIGNFNHMPPVMPSAGMTRGMTAANAMTLFSSMMNTALVTSSAFLSTSTSMMNQAAHGRNPIPKDLSDSARKIFRDESHSYVATSFSCPFLSQSSLVSPKPSPKSLVSPKHPGGALPRTESHQCFEYGKTENRGNFVIAHRSVAYYEITISPLFAVDTPGASASGNRNGNKPRFFTPKAATGTVVEGGHVPTIAIGITTVPYNSSSTSTSSSLLPGWDSFSYAYHTDDGALYHGGGSKYRSSYGPTIDLTPLTSTQPLGGGEGSDEVVRGAAEEGGEVVLESSDVDVVLGCGINYLTHSIFFTYNGQSLGTAFDLQSSPPLAPPVTAQPSVLSAEEDSIHVTPPPDAVVANGSGADSSTFSSTVQTSNADATNVPSVPSSLLSMTSGDFAKMLLSINEIPMNEAVNEGVDSNVPSDIYCYSSDGPIASATSCISDDNNAGDYLPESMKPIYDAFVSAKEKAVLSAAESYQTAKASADASLQSARDLFNEISDITGAESAGSSVDNLTNQEASHIYLYPIVGIDANVAIEFNFGHESPFMFDLEEYIERGADATRGPSLAGSRAPSRRCSGSSVASL